MKQRARPLEGFEARYNPHKNNVVIRIHYTADPEKRDPRWIAGVRKSSPNYYAFRREYEMDWSSPGGHPYYPEFAVDWEKYILQLPRLIASPVIRAWDFGYRHPGVLWMQWSTKTQRLWVIRECMPAGMDTHTFRDLVLYLSGEIELERLARRPRALGWLAELKDLRAQRSQSTLTNSQGESLGGDDDWSAIPPPPWFRPGTRFVDFAGHEATMVDANVGSETEDRTAADILAAGGIYLTASFTSINAGENVIRRLLLDAPDTYPGLFLDPACPILIKGMKGGICYPKPTKANPIPNKPMKDGFFEHLHDCLRYGGVAVVPVAEDGTILRGVDVPELQGWDRNRDPIWADKGQGAAERAFEKQWRENVIDQWK